MITDACVIILDRAKPAEREAVHEAVKSNAETWWHQFTNIWIVGGHTPAFWRNLIKPLIPDGPSAVLVLKLPDDDAERNYATYMRNADDRTNWLKMNYTRPSKPKDE